MSLTQKRLLQLPLLFLIVFLGVLPLEWTFFSQLPFYLGPVNLLTIVATYIALTRPLSGTLLWGTIIGFICSLSYPFGFGAIIAAFAWSSIATKLLTYALPFDSRIPFAALTCAQAAICKVIWRLMTHKTYHGISWFDFVLKNLPSFFTLFVLAYLLLPIIAVWDDFFENNSTKGSELNPSITGMKR